MEKQLANENIKTGLQAEAINSPQNYQQQNSTGLTDAIKNTVPNPHEKPEQPQPETEKPEVKEMPETTDKPEVEKTDIDEVPDEAIEEMPETEPIEIPDTNIQEMPAQNT